MASIRKRTWTSGGIQHTAWVCDYHDQHGKRHLKTFATKKEVDAWAVAALHEVTRGTHTATSTSITVGRACDLWIQHCEADGLERSTIRQRCQHAELHIKPFIGNEKLSSLTTPGMYAFDAALQAAGRSLAMRKKIVCNFKTILKFCQRHGYVAQNVALAVRVGRSADARHEETGPLRAGVNFPSRAELKMLIDAATGRWRDRDAFLRAARAALVGRRPNSRRHPRPPARRRLGDALQAEEQGRGA